MVEIDTRVHRALADESRVQLLRALRAAGKPLGTRELAEQAGLHQTTVRAHLDVLMKAGLVDAETEERGARGGSGRPRLLYRSLAVEDSPQRPSDYGLLAHVLASQLAGMPGDPAERARIAGLAWGRYLVERPPPFTTVTADEARATVVNLFRTLGFDPAIDAAGDRLLCRRCPYVEVARRHPDVVCSLHLGLLQGALETLGSPLTAERLDPWVEPSLCVAQLDGSASA